MLDTLLRCLDAFLRRGDIFDDDHHVFLKSIHCLLADHPSVVLGPVI